MLLNGGSRSALRPRSSNDENAVVGGKGLAGAGAGAGGGAGAGTTTKKPTVRLALGPAKSLDVNAGGGGTMNGAGVAKTPGPSNARRRAFGDISNRKAGRGPNGNGAAAAAAKTPKAVSFQSNLFGPPAKTPGNGRLGGLGGGGGGGGAKSTKKKGLQLQAQASAAKPNANRSVVSFEQTSSSSTKLPPSAVMPTMSSRKASSREGGDVLPRATSVVRDKVIAEDDGGSVSSVELPAGGRIWDPSDFFGDDDSYDLAARVAAVNASLDGDDPSFVMPTFPAANANEGGEHDRVLAKEMEDLETEEYETLDHLLNGFASEDLDGEDDDLLSGLTPSLDNDDDDTALRLDDLALA